MTLSIADFPASAAQEEATCDGVFCVSSGVEPGASGNPELVAGARRFEVGSRAVSGYATGSSRFDGCVSELVPAGERITRRLGVGSANLADLTWDEDYWVIFCPPDTLTAYTLYPDGDPPPASVIDDLILDAYQRTPVVAFNPISSPPGDEEIPLITQMETFLWVDDDAWSTPVSATASLPGFSVTTTAEPYLAHWTGGEQPAQCQNGDMHPYVMGIGGDDAQPSTCSMFYRQSSALGDHTLDLEVDWLVSYTCSIPVCGGTLPTITTRSSRPVIVGEILSVNT